MKQIQKWVENVNNLKNTNLQIKVEKGFLTVYYYGYDSASYDYSLQGARALAYDFNLEKVVGYKPLELVSNC